VTTLQITNVDLIKDQGRSLVDHWGLMGGLSTQSKILIGCSPIRIQTHARA